MLDSMLPWLHRIEFQWAWLWLVLPLPLAARLLPPPRLAHRQSVQVPNLPNLLPDAQPAARTPGRGKIRAIVFAASWFCLVLAAARPQLTMPPSYQEVSVRDLVLVLDVSASMATEDMRDGQGESVSRLSAMQEAVRSFIRARDEDNIGLIVFGSQAYPFAPLSRDHQVLMARIDELAPAMAGPQTSIGDALGSTIKMLQGMAPSSVPGTQQERMVVLLTDGRDTSSTLPPETALRLAKDEHVTLHTIAMGGTNEDIDLDLLKKMAAQTGGTFHAATQGTASLQGIYDTIDRLTPRNVTRLGWSYRLPLYPYPLAAALFGLFILLLSLTGRRGGHG